MKRYILEYTKHVELVDVYDVGMLVDEQFDKVVRPLLETMNISYTASRYIPRSYIMEMDEADAVIVSLRLECDLCLSELTREESI